MRSFSIGKPHPDLSRNAELVVRAFEYLRELLRPDLPVAELNERMAAYYKKAGLRRSWIGGYELGIAFPPDWVGWFMYDPLTDPGDRRFVPHTVVNHESLGSPSVINTIVFDEERARLLSRIPDDLIIV